MADAATRYGDWVAHFTANHASNLSVDAAIDWRDGARVTAGRGAALESLRRFELGERGDGANLLRKATDADPEYQAALRLFVAEEGEHAALLGRCLSRYGVPPLGSHWTDTAFIRIRRQFSMRWELMILACAEVVALSYYAALLDCGDPAIAAMSRRILDDEQHHVAFHRERLPHEFRRETPARTAVRRAAWSLVMAGTIMVVAADHGRAFGVCGWSRRRFARAAWRDFTQLRNDVFTSSRTALGHQRGADPNLAAVS